jgi:hypothetical protein
MVDALMTYVTITDSVMFINQDPKHYGIFKPALIDLELLTAQPKDDKAEGYYGYGERLSERARKGCDSLNSMET